MMFHPGILALLLGSILTTSMLCYAAYQGIRIIRNWDISSGSERQLELERKTYLVSIIISYVLQSQPAVCNNGTFILNLNTGGGRVSGKGQGVFAFVGAVGVNYQ